MDFYNRIRTSVKAIQEKAQIGEGSIKWALILGSGLGELAELLSEPVELSYEEIPGFPQTTVKGHENRLVLGNLGESKILIFQGRFHFYEGYHLKEVAYPAYVSKELGIPNLLVTNSCGGVNRSFQPGDLMLIEDFINFLPGNPLIGPNLDQLGPRFPDMTEPYDVGLRERAMKEAQTLDFTPKTGVYAAFQGPYYETKAEIRMLETFGVDAVGMSTVPETIVAAHGGMKVLGMSLITNMATGIQKIRHSHDNVVQKAKESSKKMQDWIRAIISED